MRFLLTVVSLGVMGLFVTFDSAPFLRSFRNYLTSTTVEVGWNREINVQTDGVMTRDEVLALAPLEESNIQWRFFPEKAERAIGEDKRVRDVEVTNCQDRWWGCFDIVVKEHKSRFVAVVGSNLWVGSEQGDLLDQIPADGEADSKVAVWFSPPGEPPAEGTEGPRMIRIRSLVAPGASPKLAEERLRAVARLVHEFESRVARTVRDVTLDETGQFTVTIDPQDLRIVLYLPEGVDGNGDKVAQQLARARAILDELGDRARGVSEIRLGFDAVGVVRLREPQAVEVAPKAKAEGGQKGKPAGRSVKARR